MVTDHSGVECSNLRRWETVAIAVAEEENALTEPLSALGRLNPLASSSTRPDSFDETPGAAFNIGTIVTTQNWRNGLGSLVGVVERDGRNKVVKDMRLYDAVHKGPTDEAELTIDRCSSATSEVPSCVFVMG